MFQRFKWDASIDKKRVTIGYLDRFKGIQEIAFDEFKGVHEDLEGIPQHRIRYYKIDNKVVWDREKKIDLLSKAGDVTHFFANQNEPENGPENPTEKNESEADRRDHSGAAAYSFVAGDWERSVNKCETNGPIEVEFINGFKILTYNVLSKFNFRRGKL